MKIEKMQQEKFTSIPIKISTTTSDLFVFILEDNDGRPVGIQVSIGKSGGELGAWAQATARLCSKILDLGGGITDLIEELSGHTTDRVVTLSNGINVRSTVEALSIALIEYNREKYGQSIRLLNTTPRMGSRQTP